MEHPQYFQQSLELVVAVDKKVIVEQDLLVVQEEVDQLHQDLLELVVLEIPHPLALRKVKMEEMVLQEQETLEVAVEALAE
jgi:hypothetical protein